MSAILIRQHTALTQFARCRADAVYDAVRRVNRLWCPRSRKISSPSGTKFAHKKLETTVSHGKNPESIWLWFDSVPGRETRTERQTELRTRLALRDVARKI